MNLFNDPYFTTFCTAKLALFLISRNAVEWHTEIATNFDNKYQTSKNFIERFSIWKKYINKYSNNSHNALDIGCGSGVFTLYMADKNKHVTGIDASKAMLEICEKKRSQGEINNVKFENAYINSLDSIVDEQQDLIICSSVLEYVDDLDASLQNISNILKPGGIFILSIPNKQSLYRKFEIIIFKLFGRPNYFRHVKNILAFDEIKTTTARHNLITLDHTYYAETPFLSKFFRKIGLTRYADNLVILVTQKPTE